MKRRTCFIAVASAVAAFCLTWGASSAKADISTYTINTPDPNQTGFSAPPPYVTATVDLTSSTTAIITFTGLSNSTYQYLIGDGDTLAVNVNSTDFSASNLSGTKAFSSFSPTASFSYDGGSTADQSAVDDLGTFDLVVTTTFTLGSKTSAFDNSWTQLSFDVTDLNGTWASSADVLAVAGTGNKYPVMAQIFPCQVPTKGVCAPATDPGTSSGSAAYVSGSTPVTSAAEPDAPVLFGMFASCLGLAWFVQSRRQRRA